VGPAPTELDIAASQDAVVMAREADRDTLVVLNDVEPRWKATQNARTYLLSSGIPIADTAIAHRASHQACMAIGKTGAEVTGARIRLR
jgi:hypothetical protein